MANAKNDKARPKPNSSFHQQVSKCGWFLQGMEKYHLSVGKGHGVKPSAIVAAISDLSGLTDKDIGRIELHDRFSFVELPVGLPKSLLNELKKTKVSGEKLAISIVKNTK